LEFLLIIALCVLAAWLRSRFTEMQSSHDALAERLDALEWRLREQSEPAEEPDRTRPIAKPGEQPDAIREAATQPQAPTRSEPSAPATQPAAPTRPDTDGIDAAFSGDTEGARSLDFEELFGRRLPIWAGGITLAIGGIFLVRLAIESGLMTPLVRVAASFVFGIVLLIAAELAHRLEVRLADPRVRQALAGAGLATLYAAFYLAGSVYQLIGPGVAFGGLALVTAGALGLAFRFGLPTALLGLVGGFATPAMVSSENPNLPLLTFYLALLAAGIAYTGQRMGAAWLGLIALLGGFGWGAVVLSTLPVETADFIASGLYLVALGTAVPVVAIRGSQSASWSYTAAGALASVQLAVLLAIDDFSLLGWGLIMLLLLSLAILGWREPAIRRGGSFAAALALLLLATWDPSGRDFALVATGLALLAAAVPVALARVGRSGEEDRWQAILVPPTLAAIATWHFHEGESAQILLAIGGVALGALAAGGAAIFGRTASEDRFGWGHAGAIALIAYLALIALLPTSAMGWALALAAGAILLALPKWHLTALALLLIATGWAMPTMAVWFSALTPALAGHPASSPELPSLASVANRIVPVALLAGLVCWRLDAPRRDLRIAAGAVAIALAVVIGHVLFRQLFPFTQPDDFVARGLLERTLWQAVLLGAGYALLTQAHSQSRAWAQWAGGALVAVTLAHFTWFGFVLHNPLWDAQAVGSVPFANLLFPSYAIAAVAAWLGGREIERAGFVWGRMAGDVVLMVLALVFALSTLRQAFFGTVLVETPMGETEDLLRSLLGILVAIAFLGWGWWREQRRWRVGSLVLMLLAVAKVFLVDAAGLDGLLRVASFLALGFSLIGIGWIYSRLLRST